MNGINSVLQLLERNKFRVAVGVRNLFRIAVGVRNLFRIAVGVRNLFRIAVGYDAVHLAETEQLQAATAEGFVIENPNDYS